MEIQQLCLKCMNGEIDRNGVCSACGSSQLKEQVIECALPLQTILHGRYLIGGTLGQGGFGITYVAYDLAENRRVVIKELFPVFLVRRAKGENHITVTGNKDSFLKYRDRFVEEAQLIYTFSGTREIVNVYHIFTENNTGYYSMEYLDGQTLQSFRRELGKPMTWNRLRPIIVDVINALRVVHQSGNIHRDISPDNIFLSSDGVAKLIDFGSARYFRTKKDMTQLLKKGFSPWEQYQSNGVFGPWTDIYALAATIYVCLTGKIPQDATVRALKDSLAPPSDYNPGIPQNVSQAIVKALSIYPQQRYRTVEEFADALQIFTEPINSIQPTNSPEPVVPSRKEHWQLRCIRGVYSGMKFPCRSNFVIGRDASRCSLVFPSSSAGISGVHLTLLFGSGPSFPGIRCESKSQTSYINGTPFNGYGRIQKLQNGDRISFGDNQIFIIERLN